ncbi:MAG: stalk domain-containing protein [Bacillota bacterium]
MKDKLKGLLIGITIGSMLTGVSAYAASGVSVKAIIQKVNLYVDGSKKTTTNALIYKGTTYVSARSVSDSIGKQVSLQGSNLYIGKQPVVKISEDRAFELLYNKIKKDVDKYSLKIMLEVGGGNEYAFRVYEDHEEYIVTFGFYYVNKTTGKVSKMDTTTGEIKNL